jgi:hypothetical protein
MYSLYPISIGEESMLAEGVLLGWGGKGRCLVRGMDGEK